MRPRQPWTIPGATISDALLDTSVVIAGDPSYARGRSGTAAISVITLGELLAGILRARDDESREVRNTLFEAVRSAFEPLPVDEHVAGHYGEALAWARNERRSEKATDLLIVATAAATGRTLFTLDSGQASLANGVGVPVESQAAGLS